MYFFSPQATKSVIRETRVIRVKIISLLAWLAVEEVGHPAAEVARFLGISRMGVHKAVIRGFELKRNHVSLG